MMRTIHASIATSVVVVALVGCNTILDNEPGLLADGTEREAGTKPPTDFVPTDPNWPNQVTDNGEAGTEDAGTTTVDAGPPPCPVGQQKCAGRCESSSDPLFGCGNPTCTPCSSAHATMTCTGWKCAVAKCDTGHADCNANAADGCEVDLSKPQTCGQCGNACGGLTPLCAPSGTTFQCTNGCPATAPTKCGAECVDLQTSTNHCGSCAQACPTLANAVSACTLGVCSTTCKPTFHACAGTCAADTDTTACGAACTVCPVPPGGAATCTAGVCGSTCPAGAHLCAGKCVLDSDATACGAACTACPVPPGGAATCAADVCGSICPAGAHLCAGRCVLDNDATACGAACTVCPVPAGGAATCVAGACGSTCPAGTHSCSGSCVADTDARACGAACTVCPAPANATAACTGGACGFTCAAGFASCDANAANGCEASLATDPLNCGACGAPCALGLLCVGGRCL